MNCRLRSSSMPRSVPPERATIEDGFQLFAIPRTILLRAYRHGQSGLALRSAKVAEPHRLASPAIIGPSGPPFVGGRLGRRHADLVSNRVRRSIGCRAALAAGVRRTA